MEGEGNGLADRVRACLRAIEGGDGAALATMYHPEAIQVELPNRLKPAGDRRDVAKLLADLDRGRALFVSQSYEVRSLVADADSVAVEVLWTGVLAVPVGELAAGDSMQAHSAMFFAFRDGRIVRQSNYDCFAATGGA